MRRCRCRKRAVSVSKAFWRASRAPPLQYRPALMGKRMTPATHRSLQEHRHRSVCLRELRGRPRAFCRGQACRGRRGATGACVVKVLAAPWRATPVPVSHGGAALPAVQSPVDACLQYRKWPEPWQAAAALRTCLWKALRPEVPRRTRPCGGWWQACWTGTVSDQLPFLPPSLLPPSFTGNPGTHPVPAAFQILCHFSGSRSLCFTARLDAARSMLLKEGGLTEGKRMVLCGDLPA